MQINKKLILIVVATLCSLCSTSYALQESLALMFAVTAARSLIATPPYIEVTSTDPVLLRGANALSLSDTQCMHTATPEEQVCFGNNLPTRIGLLPAAPLNIGFLHGATSQIEYHLLPTFVTDPVFPDIDTLSELNPAFAIATEIQQSAERQHEIIDTARQRQQTFSSHSYDKRLDEQGEKGIETDNKDFERWWPWEPEPDTNDSDMAMVHDDDSILLEPGSRYCFFSNVNDEPQARNQAVTDGESGSEEDTSSDEDSENEPEDEDSEKEPEDQADSNSGINTSHTSTDLLPVSEEVDDDYSAFMLKKIKTECDSGDRVPTMLEKLKIKCDSADDKPDPEKMVVEVEAGSTVCQSFNLPPEKKKKKTIPAPQKCSRHKERYPITTPICRVIIVGKDGLHRPCGRVFRNVKALLDHHRTHRKY